MYSGGWSTIGGKAYYFAESGAMQTGWIQYVYTYDGATYSFWYYAEPSGELLTGWQTIEGKQYYFSPDGYFMYSGGIRLIDGITYRFADDGECLGEW